MTDKDERSVLGGLSSSRPQRIGEPRKRKPAPRRPKPAQHRPKAVRSASPPLKPRRPAHAPPPRPIGAPRGTELVTTTIRAAGELTQIGLTVTGRLLKRAVDRIPRP
ncbi:MAG TPA: hypothetical protein VFZ00_12545 [Solirubrobacter sp.]|nr:hypothetical protein [Solirubrobacter sp.]